MAVLQLVKEDPKVSNYNRRGVYKKDMVVAVYDDHQVTEPASPRSSLYFVRVPGSKKEYEYLLEDNVIEDQEEGSGRRVYQLDINSLPTNNREDIRNSFDTSLSHQDIQKSFKRVRPKRLIITPSQVLGTPSDRGRL